MRRARAGVLSAGLVLAAAGVTAVVAPPSTYASVPRLVLGSAGCPDVADHEDPAHDGYNCSTVAAAVSRKWSVTLTGEVSFPLIAGGRVFVTTVVSSGAGSLYALSAKTGQVLWGPVALTGMFTFPLTFGSGHVYISPWEGPVTAFSAATGAQVWSTSVSPGSESDPVVGGGLVWVEGDGDAYGLNENTGLIETNTGVIDGSGETASDPAVKGQGLYLSTGCQKQYRFTTSGFLQWEQGSGCTEGGSGTAAIWQGRMYGSDGNKILATSDGALKGTFAGVPAFSGTTGYFASGKTVSALDVGGNGKPVWTATVPGAVLAGPIATASAIWVGTKTSKLVALDPATGAVLSTCKLPGTPGTTSGNLTPSDIGIGGNLIVVPTESTITAFG
jgi:outer membrane protein assembly factor BamB